MAAALNDAQKDALRRDGYVVYPGAVSPALYDAAVRTINARLGRGMEEREAESFVNGICFPDLMTTPPIMALFEKSAVGSVVRSAIGPFHRPTGGQIAYAYFYESALY